MPTSSSEEAKLEAIAADIAGGMEAGMPGFRPVSPASWSGCGGRSRTRPRRSGLSPSWCRIRHLTNLQPVRLGNPAAAALPRAFILCTADKDLEADPQMDPYVLAAERVRSDPNWRVIELDDNHMVNLNDPEGDRRGAPVSRVDRAPVVQKAALLRAERPRLGMRSMSTLRRLILPSQPLHTSDLFMKPVPGTGFKIS